MTSQEFQALKTDLADIKAQLAELNQAVRALGPSTPAPTGLLSVEEFAKASKRSTEWVRRRIRSGQIRPSTGGKPYRISSIQLPK